MTTLPNLPPFVEYQRFCKKLGPSYLSVVISSSARIFPQKQNCSSYKCANYTDCDNGDDNNHNLWHFASPINKLVPICLAIRKCNNCWYWFAHRLLTVFPCVETLAPIHCNVVPWTRGGQSSVGMNQANIKLWVGRGWTVINGVWPRREFNITFCLCRKNF